MRSPSLRHALTSSSGSEPQSDYVQIWAGDLGKSDGDREGRRRTKSALGRTHVSTYVRTYVCMHVCLYMVIYIAPYRHRRKSLHNFGGQTFRGMVFACFWGTDRPKSKLWGDSPPLSPPP